MIFPSFISALGYFLSNIVFLLTSIAIIIGGIPTNYKYVSSFGVTMPVITRSKSRLLQRECSEVSQVCLTCSPLPVFNPIHSNNPSTMYTSRSSSSCTTNDNSPSQLIHTSPVFIDASFLNRNTPVVTDSTNLKFENLKSVESASTATILKLSSPLPHYCHKFSTLESFNMESDCQEEESLSVVPALPDMQQLFTTLSSSLSEHISSQTAILQNQICANEEKFEKAQAVFQQEVRSELDEFRSIIAQQQQWIQSHSDTNPVPIQNVSNSVSIPSPVTSSVTPSSTTPATSVVGQDLQAQMLLLITESFSKLSTALSDNKSDSKTDWHKFSGDSKKFRAWYLGIMAHLSLPPWSDIYDSARNDVVSSTSNHLLNGKLYSKVLLSLDGTAYQNFVSRKHLRANGILLLRELVQTYKPKNVPEIIAAKTVEFWGNTKRAPNESIDSYYDRFQELLDDLADADEPIAPKAAIRQFIFTLGPEFDTIQNNFRINNLPVDWQTQDWPTLLGLCRDYYNSVKPQLSSGRRQPNPTGTQPFDRDAHQKKVRDWFLNPAKFSKEIESAQQQHPGKCIYHLSKTHSTEKCFVKVECDKLLATKKSASQQADRQVSAPGQLRHITEDLIDFEELDDSDVALVDILSNDTNEDALIYFARMSNHYLRLANVSGSSTECSRHPMKYPVIADSGANYHMFKEREFFVDLQPAKGSVLLGDGKTIIDIQGIGTVCCRIDDHLVTLHDVRYIPNLGESIYSLFVHIKSPKHGLNSTSDQGLFIQFPEFSTKAIIGTTDIYLNMTPVQEHSSTTYTPTFQLSTSIPDSSNALAPLPTIKTPNIVTKDNLLPELRRYYDSVKTKRQLRMDVPAGFRHLTSTQRQFAVKTPPRKISTFNQGDLDLTSSLECPLHSFSNTLSHHLPSSSIPAVQPDDTTVVTSNQTGVLCIDSSESAFIPIVRSVDKPSSSLPNLMSMSEDFVKACVGFRRVDTLRRKFSTLYQPSVKIDNTPADAVLDEGHFATLKKKPRNTDPVPRPLHFADVMHMDIIFGPEISCGNIHYGLLFTDRFSRMTYLYPLRNLTSDIPKQLESFFAHLGMTPKRLISDFDLKLIGGQAREYLNRLKVHVNAAPAYRQDKNGLAERHWQTMVSMSRNWLASAELPSTFWFYAVRRAAEICNYFPYQLEDGTYSTPFELVHKIKPDLRVLFRMFGLAAVRRERSGDDRLNKFESQSLPMIAVGRCQNSNGLLFFNPANGTFVSSIDYIFQPHATSGARFGYKYQPGTFIYRLDEGTTVFAPKYPLESKVFVHTHSPPHLATVVGLPTYDRPAVYTVSFADGSLAEYSGDDNILELAPMVSDPSSSIPLLPFWIQGGANTTLFLQNMSKPRHGKLFQNDAQEWIFCPGTSTDLSKGVLLPNLSATCQNLIDTGQLFRGHTKFRRVYQTRNQVQLRDTVLRHVTAHGLSSLVAPVSLKQIQKMSTGDQEVWFAAYDEEFDGLNTIPTWDIITEDQFRRLGKNVKALPSMAIATIKYDEFNRPKRAKYRIVVLGNLDYHNWSRADTNAPVMSQLELRVLTSLAIANKRVLKNCDIKQAFVQSSLPQDEVYLVKPPIGCPRSKPGTYWRLLRSLYGLKRAPKLWFNKLCAHLKSMGLQQSTISPCLFMGTLIPGQPPVYVGIYVDDIIYFSPNDSVEKLFEEHLSTIGNVDFMGKVSHFLGIEFAWRHHSDGHLSVSLTQQSFAENLIDSVNYTSASTSTFVSPYRSGLPIDSVPMSTLSSLEQDKLRLKYQSLVGSLNWLAHTTRPDLATVVSLLAQHQANPAPGHLEAALHVIKYVAQTKTLGIYFSSDRRSTLESFLHFPLSSSIIPMADANWGPQDASMNLKSSMELPDFASRSMSAFYIDLFGPLHWLSKRQSITACSSAEAEIYATNECVKFLLELAQIFDFFEVKHQFMPDATIVYNDNKACINWSKSSTSKGLRHIQMRENHVRENITNGFISVHHIDGKLNLADIFTKEMKDTSHFVELRDLFMCHRFVT